MVESSPVVIYMSPLCRTATIPRVKWRDGDVSTRGYVESAHTYLVYGHPFSFLHSISIVQEQTANLYSVVESSRIEDRRIRPTGSLATYESTRCLGAVAYCLAVGRWRVVAAACSVRVG